MLASSLTSSVRIATCLFIACGLPAIAQNNPGGPADFGDLPNIGTPGAPIHYLTTIADGGPWHLPGPPIFLGGAPDLEANGQPTAAADGDDLGGLGDDENGVALLGVAKAGAKASFQSSVTNNTGAKAYLHAMADWDGDGRFVGGDEIQVLTVAPGYVGVIGVTFDVPVSAHTATDLGVRFRISSAALDPEDPAPDGEIEDFMIQVQPPDRDFGDLPDSSVGASPSYPTTLADFGPSHAINADLYLGAAQPDFELDGQPSLTAKGDDIDAASNDEEDFSPLSGIQAGTTVTFSHKATNQSGTDAWLQVFIDWNQDGDFLDLAETTTTLVVDGSLGAPISFSIAVPSVSSYATPVAARLRLSSLKLLGPGGPAPDGEVEDYFVNVLPALDFGDLPDSALGTVAGDFATTAPDYRTTLADDGPRHVIIPELALTNDTGSADADIDAETDGQPSVAADGDDNSDDHDELQMFSALTGLILVGAGDCANTQVEIDLAINHAVRNDLPVDATLHTFIDWNHDGDFEDANEAWSQVAPASTNAPLTQIVSTSFTWPGVLNWSDTWAVRTRLSTDATLDATGLAPDGEVQDDLITINFSVSDPCPQVEVTTDFGDLPDGCVGTRAGQFGTTTPPDYRTLLADGGPSHEYDANLVIENDSGSLDSDVDFESDGQPTPLADGDDGDGNDDDLGLRRALASQRFNFHADIEHSTLTYGLLIQQPVRNTTGVDATFYAFLDANRDGDFADAGETQTVLIPADGSVTHPTVTFTMTLPWNGEHEWTETFAMRCRLSTDSSLDANGPAPDGEVQDDLIDIAVSIANPYPNDDRPTVFEFTPLTAWNGSSLALEVADLLPPDFGPILSQTWSIHGVMLEESPVLSAEDLQALGAGTHPITVTFLDSLGRRHVSWFKIRVLDLPGFSDWADSYGLAGADASPYLDQDGDGSTALVEFALGSDPTDGASLPDLRSAIETSDGDRWLILSSLRRTGGSPGPHGSYSSDNIHYHGEGSTDLDAWDHMPVPTSNPAGLPIPTVGYEWHTLRFPDPISLAPRAFLRLQVTGACLPHS